MQAKLSPATAILLALSLVSFGGIFPSECRAQQDSDAAREPAAPAKLLRAERGSYVVEMLDNTDTISQAIAINSGGALIGQRELANEDQTIFRSEYFFFDGQKHLPMPLIDGYSNCETMAISDTNLVVGFVSRAVGHQDGSLLAVAWDPLQARITPLPRPEGDVGSHAQDVSADGQRITGYCTGLERMRPCVWSQNEMGEWQVTVLPTIHEQNPYIMSSRVVISPDGKTIAACCTFDLSAGIVDSDLYLWREKDGQWQREHVTEDQLYLRDMNNSGWIVGSVTTPRGKRLPCYVESGKVKPIALLAGDVSGEAWGINADGVIVGFSDDPAGNDGGPQAFVWRDGTTTAMDFGGQTYSVAHSINAAGQIAGYIDEPQVAGEPADNAPADNAPADNAPADNAPADNAPAAEVTEGRVLAFRTVISDPQPAK